MKITSTYDVVADIKSHEKRQSDSALSIIGKALIAAATKQKGVKTA